MIYLDCAATSFQKPHAVRNAVSRAILTMSSPGRGGYPAAMRAADTCYACRELAGEMFSCEPESVVFTFNATHGLNIAINSLVKAGLITVEEAENHENRNMITRAVGADYQIESDFYVVPVTVGDRVLICTDGLYGEVSSVELERIMSGERPMTDICDQLMRTAKDSGGSDNITMIVVNVTEEDIK